MQGAAVVHWEALGAKDAEAVQAAQAQAQELARVLAAHDLTLDRDASIEELDDRGQAVARAVWSVDEPLAGYDLCSSVGAFLVAKVAVDLVPAGRTGLRHEPLRREGLLKALTDQGVDGLASSSVVADWEHVPEGFQASADGLSTSLLAGLAERTLTRAERNEALSQVAFSPRCLSRLSSAIRLLAATRELLPVLPPMAMGAEATVAMAALALGRPDRVLDLFGDRANSLVLRTFVEIAAAQYSLGQGQPLVLESDPLVLAPEVEEETESGPTTDPQGQAPLDEDDDGVLEIIEERITAGASTFRGTHPRPPRWGMADEPEDVTLLETWRDALAEHAGLVARIGPVLGLAPGAAPESVVPCPVPPDDRVIRAQQGDGDTSLLQGHGFELLGVPMEALLPPIRGLLRAIAAAAEGHGPSDDAVAAAGDLGWALKRIRALALVVRGELEAAERAVQDLPDAFAPEGRWAKDRKLRFGDRVPDPVPPDEARPAAAALVVDVAHLLARTIAHTVPNDE